MKSPLKHTLFLLPILIFWSCSTKPESSSSITKERTSIEMVTDKGTMIIELYNETPKHRDNFIKLTREGAFDSLLFHRVIENFMIQGGAPDSRYAQSGDTLGEGDPDYTVDAEFNAALFHKKGVLAAARDGNLKRASTSMQFYIVQGKVYNDSLLMVAEGRINGWLAEHYFKNDPVNKPLVDSLRKARDDKNRDQYLLFNDSIRSLAKEYTNYKKHTIPSKQREVYKSIGGTPHLDQNYTAFGEVVKGLEVIDSIASRQTDSMDRPVIDVRILTIRVVE